MRISNVAISKNAAQTTKVAFAEGNAPEEMTLVVDNVSPTAVNAIDVQNRNAREADATDTATNYSAMNFKAEGVESLTVQAEESASGRSADDDYASEMEAANSINLGQCGSLTTLKIGGTGDIAIWDLDASKISIDASAATGNVTLGVKNLTDQSIIGGSGRDMISFDTEEANVTKADWTSIEDVLMRKGGYIDASGVTGLRELWNLSRGEICEIANLKADDFYICGAPTWGENIYQHVKVNGDIGNLTWTSAERGEGEQYFSTLESNAKGNFHLNIGNKDILASNTGDGKYFSNYTLPDLQGNITVNIANATPDGAGLHITAPQAKSLEINAVGSLHFGGDTDLASVEALTLNLQSPLKKVNCQINFLCLITMDYKLEIMETDAYSQ